MKKKYLLLACIGVLVLPGCKSKTVEPDVIIDPDGNIIDNTVYPDFPRTPGDKDSWEYLKDENGNVEQWELEWYVNDSTFAWNS